MHSEGIHLTWVVVKDLDQAISFYTEKLGFSLSVHSPEFGWAELKAGSGALLGLAKEQELANEWDGTHTKAGSNSIPTITVINIEEAAKECANKGVRLLGKIMVIADEVKLQTLQDPDGNLFQLVELLRHSK